MSPHHAARPARLREAHAHLAQHGRAMGMLALADCASAAECVDRVRAEAARADALGPAHAGRWILGAGLRTEGWADPRWPAAADLDAASPRRPVCLWSFDHHSLVASSAGLAAAGLTDAPADPPNGRIDRDAAGRPTGVLRESAAHLVWRAVPEPVPAERRDHISAAARDFARHGFVEVHDLHAPAWLGPVLAELDAAGELPVEVRLYAPLAEFEAVARSSAAWSGPRVRLGGAKLFADGTLNSRTAWMLCAYADPLPGLPAGQAMVSAADLDSALERVASMNRELGADLDLAVHAIGDGAVRAVLDAAERFSRGSRARPPLRIEHAEIIDAADVPRFARLGVLCSPQPCHLLTDIEVLRRSLPHRLDRVLPLRDLINAGCEPGLGLVFGSDAPIVRPHPEDSIIAAVTRRRPGMAAELAIAPDQAIDEEAAWSCFGV